jgi:hypothetical protein
VRPTDENQAGSTRPNLMSSRRGAGEENILAMLERDSARRMGTRMSGVRLAWYGAAAALAGVLAGGVAWLAWDNHKGVQELQARHDAVVAPPAMTDAVPPPQAPPAAAPAPVVEAPRTAVIVDESARKRDMAVASTVPPLVMLPPQELSGAKPAAPAPRPAQESVVEKPAKAEPARTAPRSAAEKKPEKAAKPAPHPAKPARAGSVVKARSEAKPEAKPAPAAKARKAAAGAEAPVDSDVALISAIIQHANKRQEAEEAARKP